MFFIILMCHKFCRVSTLKEEYEEDLTVVVELTLNGEEGKNVFNLHIDRQEEYNSSFFVDFEEDVFVPKGATCRIGVHSKNVYQLIPLDHIKENIDKAKNRQEFSSFDLFLYDPDDEEAVLTLDEDGDCFLCIKSLSVVPVDEQGCLDNRE